MTLEVGGAVETYWKSTTVAKANVPRPWSVSSRQQSSPESPHRPLSSQSAAAKNHSLTVSSIIGDYVYVVVQLTQDAQPVAYPFWKLQEDKFDLYVPDLTLAQFEKLAIELGRNVDPQKQKPTTSAQWYSVLRRSMLSLAELLSVSNRALKRGSRGSRCDRRSFQAISDCVSRLRAFLDFLIGPHQTSMLLSTPFSVRFTRDGPIIPGTVVEEGSCSLLSHQAPVLH